MEYASDPILETERVINVLKQRFEEVFIHERGIDARINEPGYVAPGGVFYSRDTETLPGWNSFRIHLNLPESTPAQLEDTGLTAEYPSKVISKVRAFLPIPTAKLSPMEVLEGNAGQYFIQLDILDENLNYSTQTFYIDKGSVFPFDIETGEIKFDDELDRFAVSGVFELEGYDPDQQALAAEWMRFLPRTNMAAFTRTNDTAA